MSRCRSFSGTFPQTPPPTLPPLPLRVLGAAQDCFGDVEELPVSEWDRVMRVNVTSAFVLAQEAKTALAASGHGSMIFFVSIYGVVGPDFHLYEGTSIVNPTAYGVSKGGLPGGRDGMRKRERKQKRAGESDRDR